jgi:hypothetical protein
LYVGFVGTIAVGIGVGVALPSVDRSVEVAGSSEQALSRVDASTRTAVLAIALTINMTLLGTIHPLEVRMLRTLQTP